MPSMNKASLIGHLGKDAETKYMSNGSPKISFSLATTENWKDGDEWKSKTEWHNVVFFGDKYDYVGNLKVGNLVMIEGKIAYRSWDKEDGSKGYMTEIVGVSMKDFTFKEKSEHGVPEEAYEGDRDAGSTNTPEETKTSSDGMPVEDLPF